MSEEEKKAQPVFWTIEGKQYDMTEQSDVSKEHYVEAMNLRNEIGELQNQIVQMQRRSVNLQVALGFRENALKESIQVVEKADEAAS